MRALGWTLACVLSVSTAGAAGGGSEGERTSRISDESVPEINLDAVPERPRPIVELGNRFLGTGTLRPGFRVPGGAVWQPALLVFGTFRSALQSFDDGTTTFSEWANRLDLFSNLQLSGTERLLFGLRPIDEDGRFSGYNFEGGSTGSVDELNAQVASLFFEGDFGELFPNADRDDSGSLDLGFSIGRQPLLYQEGLLINDDIDSVGITRNTLLPHGGTDLQFTVLYGWADVHRDDNLEDDKAQVAGLFVSADYPKSTVNADFVYVFGTAQNTDGAYWGLSSVRRIGHVNVAFRVVGSHALDMETAAVSDGYLLFSEVSWTPPWTHDTIYINAFWGVDHFSSAARGPATGGPLGRVGILFAAVGLGRYGAPLGNRADDSAGFAGGYQMFSHDTRRQAIFELGGRKRTEGINDGALALGGRFQQAFGKHLILRLDAFGSIHETRDDGWGGRVEMVVQF